MQGNGWLWLILAVVVVAAIVAVVAVVGRQRKTKQAERAESMRADAGEQSRLVQQRESKAAEVDATARAAQAKSEAKAAEAQRLALTAERQKAEAAKQRSEVDDQFRKADEVDPHHDNTQAEDDTPLDGSQPYPHGVSSTDDGDPETPAESSAFGLGHGHPRRTEVKKSFVLCVGACRVGTRRDDSL